MHISDLLVYAVSLILVIVSLMQTLVMKFFDAFNVLIEVHRHE